MTPIGNSPYHNIFYYYRGPSNKEDEIHRQIEDNITKALINTLENSSHDLLRYFLTVCGIEAPEINTPKYTLQVAVDQSRPDARIQIDNTLDIYIEVKTDSELNKDQIQRHLAGIDKAFLLVITSNKKDETKLKTFKSKQLKYISWPTIHGKLLEYCKTCNRESVEKLLLTHFIHLLEEMNMNAFSGWKRNDFDAFLDIGDDAKKEYEKERQKVKGKLNRFFSDFEEHCDPKSIIENPFWEIGNLEKSCVWGVLAERGISKIDQVHFTFLLNAKGLAIGIQIEGAIPTRKTIAIVENNKEGFYQHLRRLDDFDFCIRKRKEIGVRKWVSSEVLRVKIGSEIREGDVDFIAQKMSQYDYIEVRIVKTFAKDDNRIANKDFIDEFIKILKNLKPLYDFFTSDIKKKKASQSHSKTIKRA